MRATVGCRRRWPAVLALAALSAGLWLPNQKAHAFRSYPSFFLWRSEHDLITFKAAAAKGFTSGAAQRRLAYAVRQPDWNEGYATPDSYEPFHHCDRVPTDAQVDTHGEAFSKTAEYIRDKAAAARTAAQNGDLDDAYADLGRALHAIQDCKSHSNYVDLTPLEKKQFDDALWDSTGATAPPANLKITSYDPSAADPEAPADAENYTHKDKAKDYRGKNAESTAAKFDAAFAAAVEESIGLLGRVMDPLTDAQRNALRDNPPSEADIDATYTASSGGSSCGPLGCSVSTGGTTVDFRPGSVPPGTEVKVLVVPDSAFYEPDYVETLDGGFTVAWREVRPDDQPFGAPAHAEVELTTSEESQFDPETIQAYVPNGPTGEWTPTESSYDPATNILDFEVSGGGTYGVGGHHPVSASVPAPALSNTWVLSALAIALSCAGVRAWRGRTGVTEATSG